jgi:hypothetical protein
LAQRTKQTRQITTQFLTWKIEVGYRENSERAKKAHGPSESDPKATLACCVSAIDYQSDCDYITNL